MKIESIFKAAIKELRNIKKYATNEEVGKLLVHIDELDGNQSAKCVYGLMTGSCFSDRAEELIDKCASLNKADLLGTDMLSKEINLIRTATRVDNKRYYSCLEKALYINRERIVKAIKRIFGPI